MCNGGRNARITALVSQVPFDNFDICYIWVYLLTSSCRLQVFGVKYPIYSQPISFLVPALHIAVGRGRQDRNANFILLLEYKVKVFNQLFSRTRPPAICLLFFLSSTTVYILTFVDCAHPWSSGPTIEQNI